MRTHKATAAETLSTAAAAVGLADLLYTAVFQQHNGAAFIALITHNVLTHTSE